MNSQPPKVDPNGRYTIDQTAALLGISRRTLHRWAAAGIIRQRYSRANGRPRYAGSDIAALWKSEL